MVADVPLVDLYLGPAVGVPVYEDVAFGAVTALQQFTAGSLNFTLTIAGTTTVLASGNVILNPGETRTLVASRTGASVAARATVDSTRPIGGRGQVQIVNTAPSAGSLNCYLLRPGDVVSSTTAAAAVNQPVLTFATAFVAAGAFDIVFTPPNDTTLTAGPQPLAVADGGIYTIYAADAAGGGAPYQIVVENN